MTDSDDYFVVECQPQGDVPQPRVPGRIEPRSFAKALAVWATATHRDNARHALVFHAEAPPRCITEAVVASEAFVREVEANSDAPPKPFRHHSDWARALDYHMTTALREQDLARLAWITGDDSLAKRPGVATRLRAVLLGRAPDFRPWHPRWPDVRMLRLSLVTTRGNVAFVSNASARVRTWLDRLALERGGRSMVHFRTADIQDESDARADARFDSLFLTTDQVSREVSQALQRLLPLLKPNGVVVLAIGQLFAETEGELRPVVVPDEGAFADAGLSLESATYVMEGAWRVAIQATMMQYARKATRGIGLRTPYWFAIAGGLAAISMFINIAGGRRREFSKESRVSSLLFTLRKIES